jgi:hypothetical protein
LANIGRDAAAQGAQDGVQVRWGPTILAERALRRCQPTFSLSGSTPQTIEVTVNGRHLHDIALDERQWQLHSFKLPQAVLASGLNTLPCSYRYAVAPATIVPGNPDHRTLAAAFDFIMFRVE